jgi:K+-transporting ATPase ATPase C chain
MASALRMAVFMLVVMTILTGLAYPLAVTGIAQALFPERANGSLIKNGDTVIGSKLIGQYFSKPEYFHPRLSAANAPIAQADPGVPTVARTGYNPLYSGGSNLAPSSKIFVDAVTAAVQANQPDNPEKPVPGDLVTASASGLDPEISPAAARFQVPRVAKARGMSEDQVREIVDEYTRGPTLGFLGEARVNVLRLNLALDRRSQK